MIDLADIQEEPYQPGSFGYEPPRLIWVRVLVATQPPHLKVSLPVLLASSFTTKNDVSFQALPDQTAEQVEDIALCVTLTQVMPDWTPRDDPGSGEFLLTEDGAMYRHDPNGWVCLTPHLLNP